MKNVLTQSTNSILVPSGLSVEKSAANSIIQKKIYESGTIALIIWNEEMEDIMQIVKSLEESGL